MKVLPSLLAPLLLVTAGVSASETGPGFAEAAVHCGGPPCGYITPLLEMQFAGKPRCTGSPESIDLTKCIPLPGASNSVSFEGMFRYYWKLSEDLTYPPGQEPIVVTFSGMSTNPSWLKVQVEPASITIDAQALVSPTNLKVDQTNPASPVIYYDFKAPIKVTFTRTGQPDTAGLERIAAKGGVTDVFLKARSSASGEYFKEGFGVESFRFASASLLPLTPSSQGAPLGFWVPLLGVVAVALLRRRGA